MIVILIQGTMIGGGCHAQRASLSRRQIREITDKSGVCPCQRASGGIRGIPVDFKDEPDDFFASVAGER